MGHDRLCAINDGQVWCDCAVIARVREDERARAVEVMAHFTMYSEDKDDIVAAITDGSVCTCPSESCPIAFPEHR